MGSKKNLKMSVLIRNCAEQMQHALKVLKQGCEMAQKIKPLVFKPDESDLDARKAHS